MWGIIVNAKPKYYAWAKSQDDELFFVSKKYHGSKDVALGDIIGFTPAPSHTPGGMRRAHCPTLIAKKYKPGARTPIQAVEVSTPILQEEGVENDNRIS